MHEKESLIQPVKDRLFWSGYIDLVNDTFIPTTRNGICNTFYEWQQGHSTYSAFFEDYLEFFVVDPYRDAVRTVLNPQHVFSCLKKRELCSVDCCIRTSSGNKRRLTLTVVSADLDPNSGKCIITASSVDDEYNILMRLEEQEEKHQLESKIKAQYNGLMN